MLSFGPFASTRGEGHLHGNWPTATNKNNTKKLERFKKKENHKIKIQ